MGWGDGTEDLLDIQLPFFRARVRTGVAAGLRELIMEFDEQQVVRAARRRVRAVLGFYRHVVNFVSVVGLIALLDWATGGGFFVQWVAAVWGGVLVLHSLRVLVLGTLLGPEAEQRMLERELSRRARPS